MSSIFSELHRLKVFDFSITFLGKMLIDFLDWSPDEAHQTGRNTQLAAENRVKSHSLAQARLSVSATSQPPSAVSVESNAKRPTSILPHRTILKITLLFLRFVTLERPFKRSPLSQNFLVRELQRNYA